MSDDPLAQLVSLLASDASWPLPPNVSLDDMTFQFRKTELFLLRNESHQIKRILQLRPLPGLSRTIFLVDQSNHDVNRFAIRRIAMHFSTRPRDIANRPYFKPDQMVFLLLSNGNQVSVAHFKGENALNSQMAVLEPTALIGCNRLLEELKWTRLIQPSWSLDHDLYIRYKRGRNGRKCSSTFLRRHSPELLDLFERACATSSMTQAEEDRLIEYAQGNSLEAMERVLYNNMRIVFDISCRLHIEHREFRVLFEDIFSGGLDGLMTAVMKYEPNQSHRFSTYAWRWVARNAERSLVESIWPVNVPFYVWELIKANKDADDLSIKKDAELALSTSDQQPLTNLKKASVDISRVHSLLTEQTECICNVSSLDGILDPAIQSEYDFIDRKLSDNPILSVLSAKQRELILLRYGLHEMNFDIPWTLEMVADHFNVTRERVRQIEMKAMKKIRDHFRQV